MIVIVCKQVYFIVLSDGFGMRSFFSVPVTGVINANEGDVLKFNTSNVC